MVKLILHSVKQSQLIGIFLKEYNNLKAYNRHKMRVMLTSLRCAILWRLKLKRYHGHDKVERMFWR